MTQALETVTGVHHVSINVADVDESVRWYEDKLGCVCTDRYGVDERRLRFAFLQAPGGLLLELAEKGGSEPHPRAGGGVPDAVTMQGWAHVAFQVADCDATVDELRRRDVAIAWEPRDFERHNQRVAFFWDNAGNLLELIEQRTPAQG
jgi:catechol 2,3-dioxygenase-like lactoylglutathione lyase family enzyme